MLLASDADPCAAKQSYALPLLVCQAQPCSLHLVNMHLQASCNTAVTVNGTATNYANCQALVTGLQFLWTVNTGSNGGAVLNGAIIGPSTTGWAGFGFPDSAGSMVPGNAIVVKADSSASSGEVLVPATYVPG